MAPAEMSAISTMICFRGLHGDGNDSNTAVLPQ